MADPAPGATPEGGGLIRVSGTTDGANRRLEADISPRSLRELHKAASLNQTEVVERVKRALPAARFSQAALSRTEKGSSRLIPEVVRVLCRIYGVTGASGLR